MKNRLKLERVFIVLLIAFLCITAAATFQFAPKFLGQFSMIAAMWCFLFLWWSRQITVKSQHQKNKYKAVKVISSATLFFGSVFFYVMLLFNCVFTYKLLFQW